MMLTGGLVAGATIVALLALALPLTGRHTRDSDSIRAEQTLAERFAAGKIDEQEFQSRRASLRQSVHQPSSATRWALIAVGVALLALIATMVTVGAGMGSGWWRSGAHMGFTDRDSDTSSDPIAGAQEITLQAGDLWFEPDQLRATSGAAVNITMDNDGEVFHDFTIDKLDLMIDVQAGDTVTAGLADVAPGTYEFYCSVPGHAQAGMTGTLVVDPAG